jgi:hypothetical protein
MGYIYYVVYHHSSADEDSSGYGARAVRLDYLIKTPSQVFKLADALRKKIGVDCLVITDWKLMG